MVRFVRRIWSRYAKLGKGRKKKQIWRRPTGRDNKMRERKRGLPAVVKIGYRNNKSERNEIKVLRNLNDLENVKDNEVLVMGNIGREKKIMIAEKLIERKLEVQNLNLKKFLKSERVRKDKKVAKVKSVKESGKKESSKKTEGDKK